MINWVAVFRRMLQLYNVKTQQDLGMALGVPLTFGLDGAGDAIPWPILELVVSEKRVSWDWLLTGKGERDVCGVAGGSTQIRRAAQAGVSVTSTPPPRIETRELARVLLHPGEYHVEQEAPPPPEPDAPAETPAAPTSRPPERDATADESVVRRLEDIKDKMRQEIDRVEKILEERGG